MYNLSEEFKKIIKEESFGDTLLSKIIRNDEEILEELILNALKNSLPGEPKLYKNIKNDHYPCLYIAKGKEKFVITATEGYISIMFVEFNNWLEITSLEIDIALTMKLSELIAFILNNLKKPN